MKRAIKKPVSHHLYVDEYDQMRQPNQQQCKISNRQANPQMVLRGSRDEEGEIHCRICNNFIPARLFVQMYKVRQDISKSVSSSK